MNKYIRIRGRLSVQAENLPWVFFKIIFQIVLKKKQKRTCILQNVCVYYYLL